MSAMLAQLELPGIDIGEVLKSLAKFGAIFFFIGLPILKSIVESRRKARERAGTDGAAPASQRDAQTEARRRFEELLRGEVEESAPSAPVAPPPVSRVPAPNVPPEPPARPLVVFDQAPPAVPREESLESVADEEESASREIEARLREERRRRDELVGGERDATSTRRRSAEPPQVPVFELDPIAPTQAESAASRVTRSSTASLGIGLRVDLRRALIANEVLGPPLALRDRNGSHSLYDLCA